MNSLPKEIEDIITTYTHQIEHVKKFEKTLRKIKQIKHEVTWDNDLGINISCLGKTLYFYGGIVENKYFVFAKNFEKNKTFVKIDEDCYSSFKQEKAGLL